LELGLTFGASVGESGFAGAVGSAAEVVGRLGKDLRYERNEHDECGEKRQRRITS
jgi:hypothetical protein